MTLENMIAGIVIAAVGFSSTASAQMMHPPGPGPGHYPPGAGHMQGPRHDLRQGYAPAPPMAYPEYRRFDRGDRLPPQYRSSQYIVNDWRAHHLRPPPPGHYWVQNGSDYVLVAIATGLIAAVVINALNQ